jgi:hypothetical protein
MLKTFSTALMAAALVLIGKGFIAGQGVQIETAPPAGPNASAGPSQSQAPAQPTPAEALYDYLQKYHIEVAKDQSGSTLVWTDRIFIEIPERPVPEPLASLLAAAPSNNGQFAAWVRNTFESQIKDWRAAKRNPQPKKPGTDEFLSLNGKVRCFVNPVYVAYVMYRYPDAGFLIKGPTDPILFTVRGRLKAIVSPWTKLPDGTPLP